MEAADDFVLTGAATVTSATFYGLFVPSVSGSAPFVTGVDIEFYRVFPSDSDSGRTPNVVTRTNSPADVAFASRSFGLGDLSLAITTLGSLTTTNSVTSTGINPKPNQTTGGTGPLAGSLVELTLTLLNPVVLPADHYFFVPQVDFSTNGQFYWLSASRPITGAGSTPFGPDLQAWVRSTAIEPDWSRIGTDIIGGATPPTFNMAFALQGSDATVPEPAAVGLAGVALALMGWRRRGCR